LHHLFLPPPVESVNERLVKVERIDPCPCGRGKKYKKCCLQKHAVSLTSPPPAPEPVESAKEPAKEEWKEAETSEPVEPEPPPLAADAPQRPPLPKYPRPDDNLPKLPPEQERIIEGWWEKTAPVYQERDADQMTKRGESALEEFPSLFVHLGLHEEFLFELGGELGRRGRTPDYIALLKRLRREQPET
jgi:hypothetical protein